MKKQNRNNFKFIKLLFKVILFTIVASFGFWANAESLVKPEKIPLRSFFKNPEQSAIQISPDGKLIAYLKPFEGRQNIFIKEINSESPEKKITQVKDRDIAGYFWKGNEYILYAKDFGGDENFHVFSVDVKTGAEKDLTDFPQTKASISDSLEDISKDEILVSHNHRDKKVFDLYRINIKSGKSVLIEKNPGNFKGFMTDHQGKVRLAIESDGLNTNILYKNLKTHKFENILSFGYKDSFEPAFFDFNNKNFYALSNINRDKLSVVEFDPLTKKEVRIVYQHPEVDVAGVFYSKKRKVLTSASINTWKVFPQFFDPKMEGIYNQLVEKIPNQEIRITSTNKNETLFIVRTFSDKSIGSFYLYDSEKKDLKLLYKLAADLPEESLVDLKPISYMSRDGLKINGYLALPKGKKTKNLPLIINPHGGPWYRDSWGFYSEVQFLANRGFAVLKINFRGSTGYGKKFLQASFKEWGRKMQDDITDGVNWLIEEGIANKNKICIYGGSYGGYATLAGLTKTPDLYACGVDYVGVSNLFTFLKTIPPYWTTELEKLYEMVGHPERDKEQFIETSPALNADKIKAPLLIVQGAKDPRVNKAESDQVVEALQKRGIKVQYIVKENEGHGFRNEENRFEFYEAMEKFLEKHIGE